MKPKTIEDLEEELRKTAAARDTFKEAFETEMRVLEVLGAAGYITSERIEMARKLVGSALK